MTHLPAAEIYVMFTILLVYADDTALMPLIMLLRRDIFAKMRA